jgi:uncharacterized damage-inducible protein DinB
MNRDTLAEWWDEAFHEGVWWAPWRQAIEGLTAEQAAWSPAPGRHSIWQLCNHMIFWHEYFVHRNEGGAPVTEDELERLSWQDPADTDEEAWRATRERFAATHARVRAALATRDTPPPKPQLDLRYLLFHDSYHIGQVMYIRALLGLEALES